MTTTGLYRADVPQLLAAGALQLHAFAQLQRPEDGDAVPLPLLGARVEYDEDRAPRVTATLDVPLTSTDLYEALDPRLPSHVALFAGYRHPAGWQSIGLMLHGIVTARSAVRPDDTVTVTITSTEQAVLDMGVAPTTVTSVQESSWRGLILRTVAIAFGGDGTSYQPPTWDLTPSNTVGTTGVPGYVGESPDLSRDLWDIVTDWLDQVDANAYDRGDTVWQLTYRTTSAGTPVHTFTSGAGGNLIGGAADTVRGDGYANRVVLEYNWTDASNNSHRVQAMRDVLTGPLAVDADAANVVTNHQQRDTPTTQTKANAAAAQLVTRLSRRGLLYRLQAPAALWVRPEHTVTYTPPLGGSVDLIVSRVEYDLRAGTMAAYGRVPDGTITVGAPV